MSRRIIALCTAILVLFSCACPVFAKEWDADATGSISVTLADRDTPVAEAELHLYYVARVNRDAAGVLRYIYTAEFEGMDVPLDDPALVNELDAFLAQNQVSSQTMTTDAQGVASCRDLPLGLYFVQQTGLVEGFAPCTPFLVTIPGEDGDGYVYDVNATPKTEVEKWVSITVKKEWNTDDSTAITESVTVQLRRDGKLVRTAILNAQNDWQITYTNMPASDAYSIKEVDVPEGFTATYGQDGYVFTVTNSSTLIQTGQLMWPIPVLAVAGMLLLVVGVVLLQKKRKPNA